MKCPIQKMSCPKCGNSAFKLDNQTHEGIVCVICSGSVIYNRWATEFRVQEKIVAEKLKTASKIDSAKENAVRKLEVEKKQREDLRRASMLVKVKQKIVKQILKPKTYKRLEKDDKITSHEKFVALLLLLFLGGLGAHQYYLGNSGKGFVYTSLAAINLCCYINLEKIGSSFSLQTGLICFVLFLFSTFLVWIGLLFDFARIITGDIKKV